MSELLPCPLCGASGTIAELSNGQYYPRCTGNYGSDGSGWCLLTRQPDPEVDGYATKEEAVRQWNRRGWRDSDKESPKDLVRVLVKRRYGENVTANYSPYLIAFMDRGRWIDGRGTYEVLGEVTEWMYIPDAD